jgi:DNA-binding SARP family transcriptional activator
MPAINVRLFGRFGVWCDGRPATGLNARRACELLSYLVLHRDRAQQREALAGQLWEDAQPAQGRKYLRQALWQLHTALRLDEGGDGPQVLQVGPEWIQLNSCDQVQVDVIRFEEATRLCRGIPGSKLDDASLLQLEQAVALYRGDLLDGWYQDWCLFERERLQNEFLDMLEKLVTSYETRRDCERGLAHARRMLAVDPAREQAHRHVMRLQVLAGNHTEALREYERCERSVMQELGVKPSEQTRALHESIRQGRFDGVHADGDAPGTTSSFEAFTREQIALVLDRLERLQALVGDIESALRRHLTPARDRH